MTPEQFYADTVGKRIDVDGYPKWQPYQCIDLFRYWGQLNGVPVPATPDDRASGYWTCLNEKSKIVPAVAEWQSKYFVKITDPTQFRTGDWIIWGWGGSHPETHVAMYYHGQEYGENQGGNASACLKTTDFSDALGALRWKGYIMEDKTIEQLAYEVLAGLWGNGEERKQRLTAAGYDYAAVQAKVNEILGNNQVEDPEPEPEPTPEPVPEPKPVENPANTLLPNNVYDILKWICLIALPAVSAFVLFMGTDLNAQYELIAKWINGIMILLGSLIGVSTVQYNNARSQGK